MDGDVCPEYDEISMELALYNPVYEDMAIKFSSIISTLQKLWKILAKEKMDFGTKKTDFSMTYYNLTTELEFL